MKRIGVISVHTCPLAALGGKETGGMNVYVREVARHLGRLGLEVDVFTRKQTPGLKSSTSTPHGMVRTRSTGAPQYHASSALSSGVAATMRSASAATRASASTRACGT